LLEIGNKNAIAAKLSLKNPGKWQFRVRKALAWGGYAVQKTKIWSSSTSLVATNGYSHHHHLLDCSMAGRNILLLYPAECQTGATGPW